MKHGLIHSLSFGVKMEVARMRALKLCTDLELIIVGCGENGGCPDEGIETPLIHFSFLSASCENGGCPDEGIETHLLLLFLNTTKK